MNTKVKVIIIVINIIIIGLSLYWYFNKDGNTHLITSLVQFIALIALINEKRLSKVLNRSIENSEIEIKKSPNTDITNEDIKNSKIKITEE